MAKKGRQRRQRRMRPTYFVFCEGETEKVYVEHLRAKFRIPIEIDIQIKNHITEDYINRYKQRKFTTERDKTFLMYDLDVSGTLEKLNKIGNAILLVSNPCIELWFALHTGKVKVANRCKKLVDSLKQNFGYQKAKLTDNFLRLLDTNEDKAIERAKSLKLYNNPSTSVFRLIEIIKQEKEGE